MDWFFLIFGSVCFVEIFIRLNSLSRIKDLNRILKKVSRVLTSSRISDHWKEKVLPRYSLMLFKQSLLIFGVLVASFMIFVLLAVISELLDSSFITLSSSFTGIAVSTCIALSYVMVRTKLSPKTIDYRESDYSTASKILHHISLGAPFVGDALFDMEKSIYSSKSPEITNENHVFVCGLARAGTTVLMRRLYESGQFVSLTYRDMPFVLALNLWRKLNRLSSRHMETRERAHGDGVMVDYDSPEALEEVFWRSKCGSDYILEDCLIPMTAPDETINDFRSYVSLILTETDRSRYLSKNNNNILRLRSITETFPGATILIPFRQPEQQAYSLMKQHQRFVSLHSKDHFSQKYMTWLVHHEFGSDHRPFRFDEQKPDHGDPEHLNYWLEVWLHVYSFITDNMPDHAHLVCYETLCEDSERVWGELAELVQLSNHVGRLQFSGSYHQLDYSFDDVLLNRAKRLYENLRQQAVGHRIKPKQDETNA